MLCGWHVTVHGMHEATRFKHSLWIFWLGSKHAVLKSWTTELSPFALERPVLVHHARGDRSSPQSDLQWRFSLTIARTLQARKANAKYWRLSKQTTSASKAPQCEKTQNAKWWKSTLASSIVTTLDTKNKPTVATITLGWPLLFKKINPMCWNAMERKTTLTSREELLAFDSKVPTSWRYGTMWQSSTSTSRQMMVRGKQGWSMTKWLSGFSPPTARSRQDLNASALWMATGNLSSLKTKHHHYVMQLDRTTEIQRLARCAETFSTPSTWSVTQHITLEKQFPPNLLQCLFTLKREFQQLWSSVAAYLAKFQPTGTMSQPWQTWHATFGFKLLHQIHRASWT